MSACTPIPRLGCILSCRLMTGKLQYASAVYEWRRVLAAATTSPPCRGLRWPMRGMPPYEVLSVACLGSQRLLSLIVWFHLQIGPARQARSYPEPSGPRERGFVERFKEHYGFIRCILATCCWWSTCISFSQCGMWDKWQHCAPTLYTGLCLSSVFKKV